MNTHKVTPKDFFLWAGAMIAFYVSMFSFITLLFEYINNAYPDALSYGYTDPYSGAIRFAIASLIVLFPVFLILMRVIRNDIQKHSEKKDLWVRRWALFLTVFIAGAAVAIDLITLVNSFLGGELSTRFVLKVVVILLVAGGTFLHFMADVWGYWLLFPKKARSVGYAAALVVLLTIIAGFFIMGSPSQVRMYRFDDQKVSDLTNLQWQIVNYYQQKGALPADLSMLQDPISGYQVPTDPQTGNPYAYRVTTAPYSFEMCADFNATSDHSAIAAPVKAPQAHVGGSIENSTWTHDAGSTCFERTIDPQMYPVFNKNATITN
ncbi:MAG: hypothetical protein JWM46_701 [Candidatus Kaiserbacteria bacterium]|nr:hypothetical protein [Candidatus Kaiserbacteria bacterium]